MPLAPRARVRAATLSILLLLAAAAHAQSGGAFEMESRLIGPGGATFSTGGGFRLGGSIGQAAALELAGGGFTLDGGFWPQAAARVAGVDRSEFKMTPLRLAAPAPNPFHGSTVLSFALEHDTPVRLEVFDITGHRVRTLLSGTQHPGVFRVAWNGDADRGSRLSPGIYFVHLDAASVRTTRRVALLD